MSKPTFKRTKHVYTFGGVKHIRFFEMRLISSLKPHPKCQRGRLPGHIADMFANFYPPALKPIVISDRGHGVVYILDGQQETAAAEKAGMVYILCDVRYDLTLEEEARLFILLNNHRAVAKARKFSNRLIAKDREAIAIYRTVLHYGMTLKLPDHPKNDNLIKGFVCIDKIFSIGGEELLEDTMQVLRDSFTIEDSTGTSTGTIDRQAIKDMFILGLGLFIWEAKYLGKASIDTIIAAMKKVDPVGAAEAIDDGEDNRRAESLKFKNHFIARLKAFETAKPKRRIALAS